MERERERTNNIQKARRDAAKATNAKRRNGQRDGDRDGDRSGQRDGDRSGDRVYPQPQLQIQKPPHPSGGGAGGGEGISATQGSKPAAVSPARGQGSTQARPNRSDGSTPHPTPSDAPKGISGDVVLRDPTPHEMGRITRWPGNRILPPEAIAAQQRGYIKGLREKGVGPDLIVAAWNRALTEWGERGINPYEFLRKTLLADWEGVRNADAVMRHRLGLKEQVA